MAYPIETKPFVILYFSIEKYNSTLYFWTKVQKARSSALLPRLVDDLFSRPFLTIPLAQRVLGVTYRAAKLNVEKLIAYGILKDISDRTYNRIFLAPEVMEIIETTRA